jgi:hypothetical protein
MGRAVVRLAVTFACAGACAAVFLEAGPIEREAGACSCLGPQVALRGPDRVDDAPRNVRVRVEVPVRTGGAPSPPLVLRVHGGDAVATTTRTASPGGAVSTVELVPAAPLAAATQYEVSTTDPAHVPAVTVYGTFRTGDTRDVTAPRIDALGAASVYAHANARGEACQIPGPWVVVEGVHASDPGRPQAQLAFAVWLADATGALDPRKPPTAILWTYEDRLTIGASSLCDPHAFPIPKAASMVVGIAALDEAGNQSAVRRITVNLGSASRP